MHLHTRIIELLQKVGLTQSEATFYVAVLRNPKLTLKQLQKKTGLSKTSTYRIFDKLFVLGLISSSSENWRKTIEAVSLDNLSNKIGKEQRKLRKIQLELKKLNNLMNLNPSFLEEDPIDIIVDENKIKEKAFEILSKDWDRFQCFGSAERLIDIIGDTEEHIWVNERTRRGKGVDVYLTELGTYSDEFLPRNEKEYRNVRIDASLEITDYCTYVYGDEVAVWHKDKELGVRTVIITDPIIVNMQQKMFEKFWKNHESN